MSKVSRVLVIDDHPLFRKGAFELIAMADELEFAGEASSGREGVELATRLVPDLILLDVNMKGMGGLETLRLLKAATPSSRVVMLTVSDSEENILEALRNGADGYLLKDMEPDEILDGLVRAARGKLAVNDRITGALVSSLRRDIRDGDNGRAHGLTEREEMTLRHLARGQSNKLIARTMGISDTTVKFHVKSILRKLKLCSRTEAAIWALEHGYITNERKE